MTSRYPFCKTLAHILCNCIQTSLYPFCIYLKQAGELAVIYCGTSICTCASLCDPSFFAENFPENLPTSSWAADILGPSEGSPCEPRSYS